jgi:manganese efflux pump family protein
MDWWTLLVVAIGLGMDAFAVAIAVGARLPCLGFHPVFRLSFHFGLFQFLMPIIGWLIGHQIERFVKDWAHWIAFALLLIISVKMIREALTCTTEQLNTSDPTRRSSLIILSVATSIDAFVVGFSVALLQADIVTASIVIGVVAATMTSVGMGLGRTVGFRLGRSAGVLGGIILLGIGLKILIENGAP